MIFAVYKEKGPTSRDVLNKIKKITGEKKVGHAGTLDPLAEGVLLVGIGRESTKKLHSEIFNEKEYLAVIFLGEKSITDDREGKKEKLKVKSPPTFDEVTEITFKFKGPLMQTPPYFSAVKVNGQESYKLARKGSFVPLKKRKTEVKENNILAYRYPLLKIKIVTGSGFYVRSLARDIGEKLKTGGYLYSLVRTRVGDFKIENCKNIEDLRGKIIN